MIELVHPQELEVYFILPALRRELARTLKKQGKTHKAIAGFFGVTVPAVSQYLHAKRGAEIKFTAEFQKIIADAATHITDRDTFIKQTQQLMNKIWNDKFICQVCHDQTGSAKNCEVCFE